MATSDQKPQLAAIFTQDQQTLIGQIVNKKISEIIASSSSLVCSHCSSNSSNNQLPWLPADSNVAVQTSPLQAFDKQLTTFKRQLSELVTKLQQFIDNHSCSEVNTSNPSNNSVAANLITSTKLISKLSSVEQRLTDLEYRFNKFESSVAQSSKLDPKSESVDTTRLLEEIQAKYETKISKEHKQLAEFVQQLSECTASADDVIELKAIVECMARVTQTSEHIDINQMTVLQSVAVDRHEVLNKLVSNIKHKHEELAEFVRQLSECTASANDVIELKAVVECMARVTGVSEPKAEQLITEFIGREGGELEHLKRELRLVNEKILELQLARNQIANIHDSAYRNQLPYLNVLAETMQDECERYKRDLNAMADNLSERLNAKVAQAIQQSLVDKHQQTNKAHLSLASTEGQDTQPRPSVLECSNDKIITDMLQPSADDGNTVSAAAAAATTAALKAETDLKRHQDKDTAISSPPASVEKPAETGLKYTRMQQQDQLSNSSKPLDVAVKSISKSPFKQVAEPLSMQHLTTATQLQQQPNQFDYATIRQSLVGHWPVIKCLVVGHESALTGLLIQAYVKKTGSMIARTLVGVGVNVHVPVRYGTVDFNLHLDNCTRAKKLKQITVCDIVVICFSVVDKASYQHVRKVWVKQVKQEFPDIPYLLVGTQVDQRQTTGVRHFQVKYEQGLQLCRKIEAVAYFECSELDDGGAEAMFNCAVQHVVDKLKYVSRPSIK